MIRIWRFLRRIGWKKSLALGVVVGALSFTAFVGVLYAVIRVPEPNDISSAQSVQVLDHDGKQLGRIHAEADRVSIPFEEMPLVLRRAVIATEDRKFTTHKGLRLTSIVRAALANVRGGRQGGSTITQQYVKNAFVGADRSVWRKVKEAVLAVKLERQKSKDEILTDYLNTIYFGRGAYGCEAASRAFFGKRAKDLSLAQAALLAGMIKAPTTLDPANDAVEAKARRDQVLAFMERDDYISARRAETTAKTQVRTRPRASGGIAPHYLEEVRRSLEESIGARALYEGGVVVTASLDLEAQKAAEEAVATVYDRASDPQAALVAIDPRDGAVRAMVGSRSFQKLQLNIATRGRRQPGSIFKTPVLAAYLDAGYASQDVFRAPGSIEPVPGARRVSNYDRRDHGRLTVERATWNSVNTVYIQMIKKTGARPVVSMAEAMGINSKLDPVLGLALGVSDVTPLEMADVYATLAAHGIHHDPYLVQQVRNRDGDVLFEAVTTNERALEPADADEVSRVLRGVIDNGTGAGARLSRPAAGKTGTTENFRDAWFAGYTPDLAAVVWNGYPQAERQMRGVRGRNVTGGSFPAQMWKLFMERALEGVSPTPFKDPPAPTPSATATATPSPSPSRTPTSSLEPTVAPTVVPTLPTKSPSPSPTGPSPTPSASASPSP